MPKTPVDPCHHFLVLLFHWSILFRLPCGSVYWAEHNRIGTSMFKKDEVHAVYFSEFGKPVRLSMLIPHIPRTSSSEVSDLI